MDSLACVVCGHIGALDKDSILMLVRPICLCGDCSRRYNDYDLTDDEMRLVLIQQRLYGNDIEIIRTEELEKINDRA